ncbi:MAG: hypothetical protein HY327_04415 [Chloroflexi bacterium]|nr:hypothetical protein [Chloroflexota bacterium]
MITHPVTLELPESLYQTASRVATLTGKPLETVLESSIAHALPPLDDVLPDEAASLAALALLDDTALWQEARAMMSDEEQTKLHDLLDRQEDGELTPAEQNRLQALVDSYGHGTLRKAHAYLLLARRGFHVPMQEE